jgi:hypothetical protein
MDNTTLKQLMDPEFQTAQARYENYRIAVDKAYKMADSHCGFSRTVDNGENATPRYVHVPLTSEEKVRDITNTARLLIPAIYEDMEKAISMLEKKEATDGNKGSSSKVSRHS